MSIDLLALRSEVRVHIGVDDTELVDEDVDLLLNRSYWELLDKFPFREKEVTATFVTVAGTRLYAMPSPFEALRQLSIENPGDFKHHDLQKMTIHEYENKYVNTVESQGFPTHYVREGCAARLWPTPDQAYNMVIKYWTVLADLTVTDADPDGTVPIPQAWHEIILFGGIWRAYIRLGDFSRGNQMKAHQVNLIQSITPVEAKEEFDTHTAGVQAMRPRYNV